MSNRYRVDQRLNFQIRGEAPFLRPAASLMVYISCWLTASNTGSFCACFCDDPGYNLKRFKNQMCCIKFSLLPSVRTNLLLFCLTSRHSLLFLAYQAPRRGVFYLLCILVLFPQTHKSQSLYDINGGHFFIIHGKRKLSAGKKKK